MSKEDLGKIKYLSLSEARNDLVVKDIFDITGIGILINLEKIDLQNSYIISLPDEIENLSKLEKLNLNNNQIVYVSENISKLDKLKEVSIYDYSLKNKKEEVNVGNVPVKFLPQSEITFNEKGAPTITKVVKPNLLTYRGNEIGGNLTVENPKKFSDIDLFLEKSFKQLPIFKYNECYTAREGAVAIYGSNGELVRVRGNYEYESDLEKYIIDGNYSNGRYIGKYSEFSVMRNNDIKYNELLRSTTYRGYFTTYGDYWPAIPTYDTDSNRDPVPNRPNHSSYYGDRIGTRNNKLRIGDAAPRREFNIPYNTKIMVTVQASDTNGSGTITKEMTVRDIMGATAPVLDIWRWDNSEWFSGTPQNPYDLYFGQRYSEYLSFSNQNNYFYILN